MKRRSFPSPNGGELVAGLPGYQLFDSLAVDAEGNICVATLFNGGITVISPDGKSIEHVPMPDVYTTNLCFGGKDLRTAYVTLSPGTGCPPNWSTTLPASATVEGDVQDPTDIDTDAVADPAVPAEIPRLVVYVPVVIEPRSMASDRV